MSSVRRDAEKKIAKRNAREEKKAEKIRLAKQRLKKPKKKSLLARILRK